MTNTPTAQLFFDHKRAAHSGAFKSDCQECQQKWEALLAEVNDGKVKS